MAKHKIVYRPIEDLIEAEYNPRQLSDEQFSQIRESLSKFGFVDPVIINTNPSRTNIIIGGHQRIKVAKTLGIHEVPCIELNLSLEEELNIRLNKNTGEFDHDLLNDFFDSSDLLEWGFTADELGIAEEQEPKEITKTELKPYEQAHVLLSFPPEKIGELMPHLELIRQIEGVEYETSAN